MPYESRETSFEKGTVADRLVRLAGVEPHLKVLSNLENKESRSNSEEILRMDLYMYVLNELDSAKESFSGPEKEDAARYVGRLKGEYSINTEDIHEVGGEGNALSQQDMEKELLNYYISEYLLGMRTPGEQGNRLRKYATNELQSYLKSSGAGSLVELGKKSGIVGKGLDVLAYCDPTGQEFGKPTSPPPEEEIAEGEIMDFTQDPPQEIATMDFTKEREKTLAIPIKRGATEDDLSSIIDAYLDERRGELSLDEFREIKESVANLKEAFRKYSEFQSEVGDSPTQDQLEELDNRMEKIEEAKKELIKHMDKVGEEKVLPLVTSLSEKYRKQRKELESKMA
ncbi:hypothetical protein GF415_04635 [Candidatus Micrarchaeota archaeon]|nr:hypothetical protein [Candidatus Micrarchaeota archaeon]